MKTRLIQLLVLEFLLKSKILDRKLYTVRRRRDPFLYWDENEFYKRFRVSKRTAHAILKLIRRKLEPKNKRFADINKELWYN